MRNPGTVDPGMSTEITFDKGNGKGYWSFTPVDPTPLQDGLSVVAEYGHFTEASELLKEVANTGSVLVEGEPGSGKSHVVREIQEGCQVAGVPCFCLTVHVNAGKATGIEAVKDPLEAFLKASESSGGLIVLDNIDYLGYKSKSHHGRRRGAAQRYAQDAVSLLALINDPKYAVIGTAHNDAWRETHHTWEDPQIDGPTQQVLDGFKSKMVFEGRMALVGLAEIVWARNLSRFHEDVTAETPALTLGQAARVVRLLHEKGRDNFFHANHLDAALFLTDPTKALAEIDSGRHERTYRSSSS